MGRLRSPIVGPLLDDALKDPGKLAERIPDNDRFKSLRSSVMTSMDELKALRGRLTNPPSTPPSMQRGEDAIQYTKVLKDVEFLSRLHDSNQLRLRKALFNKQTEEMYYRSGWADNQDGAASYSTFHAWYYNAISQQIQAHFTVLLNSVATVVDVLDNEFQTKQLLKEYQQWMADIQRYWRQYVSLQIKESTDLLQSIEYNTSTKKRISVFSTDDVMVYKTWKSHVNNGFVALAGVLLLVIAFMNKHHIIRLLGNIQAPTTSTGDADAGD